MRLLHVFMAVLLGGGDPPAPVVHWEGAARLGARGWRIELWRAGDSVWISVPELWSPRQPAGHLSLAGDSMRFDMPLGVGRIQLRVHASGRSAVGVLQTAAGASGTITLRRTPAASLRATDFLLPAGGVTIAGSVTSSGGARRKPAVIILHGGGNSQRADSPPYRFWGDYLAARGFVAVTYDKRGNGASTGAWQTVGFSERADDVLAIVHWLRGRPEVDPDRVGLFAVSQGTWVATLAASRDPRLAFLVQVSGPVGTPLEADTRAAVNGWRAAGLDSAEVAAAEQMWRLEASAIMRPGDTVTWNRYRTADAAARSARWYAKARYAPSTPQDWFTNWYQRVAAYDPAPDLRRLRMAVLCLYGDLDTQSDVSENIRRIAEIRASAPVRFEVARFPATGHGMLAPVDEAGRATAPLATPPGFFRALEEWLERAVAAAPPQRRTPSGARPRAREDGRR